MKNLARVLVSLLLFVFLTISLPIVDRFGIGNGIAIAQTSIPTVNLASPTVTLSSGRGYFSGISVSDTSGNPLTLTIKSSTGMVKISSPGFTYSGGGTASNPATWTYKGSLSQVNTALQKVGAFLGGSGSYPITITASNGDNISPPVSLTLKGS